MMLVLIKEKELGKKLLYLWNKVKHLNKIFGVYKVNYGATV